MYLSLSKTLLAPARLEKCTCTERTAFSTLKFASLAHSLPLQFYLYRLRHLYDKVNLLV